MLQDIRRYIQTCDSCQRRGNKGSEGQLNPIGVEEIFERIGVDFVGPLPRTKEGNKYICVATEYLTKWPEAIAMKEATAEKVVEFIYKKIICRYGCPKIILTDRGTHFRNQLVEGLCEKFSIKHKLSSPYHPQTNGLVERFNRTLCEMLAKVIEEENQWDEYIDPALFAYRTTKHNTTKRTPYFMLYGKEAKLPIDEMEKRNENYKESILKRTYELIDLTEERNLTVNRIKKVQGKQKERFDRNIKEKKFKIGEKVLLKDSAKEKQWSGKLLPKWKGPFYIHDVIGKGAYKLKTLEGKVLKNPYNIKHLKEYFERSQPRIYL
jgi:hypothetical protein